MWEPVLLRNTALGREPLAAGAKLLDLAGITSNAPRAAVIQNRISLPCRYPAASPALTY